MEFKCSLKIETPTPVKFRESFRMPDWFDFELSAHIAMSINVIEYDESKYGDCEQLIQTLKEQMQEILTIVLNEKMKGFVMRGAGPQKYFKDILEEELFSMGVTAEIENISFVLTEESEKLYMEKFEEAKIVVRMEATRGNIT